VLNSTANGQLQSQPRIQTTAIRQHRTKQQNQTKININNNNNNNNKGSSSSKNNICDACISLDL
jgi:hypothetical protein